MGKRRSDGRLFQESWPINFKGFPASAFAASNQEDDADFAAALAALLRDREAAQRMGARGRELVRERFLVTRWLADLLRVLAALPSGS